MTGPDALEVVCTGRGAHPRRVLARWLPVGATYADLTARVWWRRQTARYSRDAYADHLALREEQAQEARARTGHGHGRAPLMRPWSTGEDVALICPRCRVPVPVTWAAMAALWADGARRVDLSHR